MYRCKYIKFVSCAHIKRLRFSVQAIFILRSEPKLWNLNQLFLGRNFGCDGVAFRSKWKHILTRKRMKQHIVVVITTRESKCDSTKSLFACNGSTGACIHYYYYLWIVMRKIQTVNSKETVKFRAVDCGERLNKEDLTGHVFLVFFCVFLDEVLEKLFLDENRNS